MIIPDNAQVLFETTQHRDILVTVSPSMEDHNLEYHIIEILNRNEFITIIDNLNDSDRIEYWIEDRIHQYHSHLLDVSQRSHQSNLLLNDESDNGSIFRST